MIQDRLRISKNTGTLTYLGVPITRQRLWRVDCRPMEQRVQELLDGWQANTLSMMGRITLVRSVLSSLLTYLLANTVVPCSCLRDLEQQLWNFLWGSRHGGRRLHLLS